MSFNKVKIGIFSFLIVLSMPIGHALMGRWNLLEEIWVEPFEHWIEIISLALFLLPFLDTMPMKTKRVNYMRR